MTQTNTTNEAHGAAEGPQRETTRSVSGLGEVGVPQRRSAAPALHGRNTGSSAHLKQRAFVPFQGRILAEYYGGSTRGALFHHPDELGSLSTAIDYATSHFAERLFYPFGEFWQGSDFYSLNPHQTFAQLPDYDNDSNSDLYNTLNRHYTPMGRWLSPDPGGLKVVRFDDPQTWNMYAYVRNNPTTLVDPLGLQQVVVECSTNMKTCVGAQEKPQPPTDKPTQKQEWSTWEAPGVVGVQGTTTTTSTDESGNTTTTVTTTVALYSTEKGQEGTFQGATQWVNTTVTSPEGKVLSTTPSGRLHINREDVAARSLGSEAINSAIAQTVPSRSQFFFQSAWQHRSELAVGAIALGLALTPAGPLEAPKAVVDFWWAANHLASELTGSH